MVLAEWNAIHASSQSPTIIVGAGLVPAPNLQPQDNQPPNNRATTRVAPTVGDVVGAGWNRD